MRLDKLTIKAQEAVQSAQNLAEERQSPDFSPDHLLSALIEQEDGTVRPILQKLGLEVQSIQKKELL